MSSYAITDQGDVFFATDGKPDCYCFCAVCRERVDHVRSYMARINNNLIRVEAHFRHQRDSQCPETKKETAEHLAMKAIWMNAFPGALVEQTLHSGRRADLIITCRDGRQRSVECQHSPIDILTVSRRIVDHNSDGLPVTWSFSPARLKNHAVSLFDGVTEALNTGAWRTIYVAPAGSTFSAYAFYDMRFIDNPDIVKVQIDLTSESLVDLTYKGKTVTVADHDEDRLKWTIKKSNKKYYQLTGEHTRFLDYAERAKSATYNAENVEMAWRRLMLEWSNDVASEYSIPITIGQKQKRNFCDKLDKEKNLRAEAEAEAIERKRMAEAKLQHDKWLKEQHTRQRARVIASWVDSLRGRYDFTTDDKKQVVKLAKLYAQEIGVDLTKHQKVSDGLKAIWCKAKTIAET